MQTRNGYIWVATEGGIARFDGVTFEVYRHQGEPAFTSDDVCCLAEDRAGALWIGTRDGVVRLQDGKFRRFGEEDGLPSSPVISLASLPNGSLLVLTTEGLLQGDHGHFQKLSLLLPRITGMERAAGGGVWLIGEGEVLRLQDGKLLPWRAGKQRVLPSLMGMAEGGDGTMWMWSTATVTMTMGGVIREWKVGHELPGVRVESLSLDRAGIAWVGTSNGLVTVAKGSGRVSPVMALEGKRVLQTFEDAEGNRWVGTEASGLHILRPLKFRSEPSLDDKAVTGMVQTSDGSIWVGTRDDGLRRIRGDVVDVPVGVRKLTSPVILSLVPGRDSSVWAGTPDGLNHVKSNGSVTRITSANGLPDDYIRSLLADNDGSVWIGTRQGLAHLHGGKIETLTKSDGLGSDMIGSLLRLNSGVVPGEGAGCLLIGTSVGLSCLHKNGKVTILAGRSGLEGEIVTAMTQDRVGALWIATRDGKLSRFTSGHLGSLKRMPHAAEIDGMVVSGGDFLWLRTKRGIERVSMVDLNQCVERGDMCSSSIAQFGVADGMPSEEEVAGGSPAAWRMANGELWFATRRGPAIVDAEHLPLNIVPPPVVIQRLVVDGTDLEISSEDRDGAQLNIPFGPARFSMEYAALSFTAPAKVGYRFMLEGFDHEWTNAGNRRSATYTNLPSREYLFRVQAMNNDGVWNETGAELRFRIIPPFYRRWWFALLVVFFAIGLFAGLYRLRLRQLRARFDAVLAERNRMAREIHDTLAQDFVGVSIHLDIVSQLLEQSKVKAGQLNAAIDQVQQTRKLVVNGLADARQSIWQLRANTAEDSLPTRLANAVKRYSVDSVATHLRIGGVFRPLEARIESEILRVAQEALSNVQRHAGASEVSIELQYGSDMLVLTVEDDGAGFVVDQAYRADGHYGLRGMQERAAALGGRLEILSEAGRGAKLTLLAPIARAER